MNPLFNKIGFARRIDTAPEMAASRIFGPPAAVYCRTTI
jgi:hypothetical protein